MITMAKLLLFQTFFLLCIFRELKCQPQSPNQNTPPQQFPQNGQLQMNTQQGFPQGPQSLPLNSQQWLSQTGQQPFPTNGQFQQLYTYPPPYPASFQSTQFQQPGAQTPNSMQQPFTQQSGTQQFPGQQQQSPFQTQQSGTQQLPGQQQQSPFQTQQSGTQQLPGQQQQSSFQTQQNPSFSDLQFPPTATMPYPIQGQSAEFLQRPNANQLQTNQGQFFNPGQQAQPDTQFYPQGQSGNQPSQGPPSTQFTQGQSGTQLSTQGQPSAQFGMQEYPGIQQLPNQQQASALSNMTPQGIQNAAPGTGTQTVGQNPSGIQDASVTQPSPTPNAVGSQSQPPIGTQTQQLPGTQTSPVISTPTTTTQNGLPSTQDSTGLQFNSPEAQTAATYIMKQLASILNDPGSRDAFVLMMSDFRNMLSNPQAYRVIQAYNGQIQDRLNNPNAYNNNVPAFTQNTNNNPGMIAPTITSPGGYHYHNQHPLQQPTDLASIITTTTSSLADLLRYKGRVLTNLLRDEVQVKSNAVDKLLGDIPGVNAISRLGTGLANQFVGQVDRTVSPFLNSGSAGDLSGMTNAQLPGLNTITRMGSNVKDQAFGFLNMGGGGTQTQAPATTTPPNSNNNNNVANGSTYPTPVTQTAGTNNNYPSNGSSTTYPTTVTPTGTNYPGYNEFSRQNK